jgi:hypothetical protein
MSQEKAESCKRQAASHKQQARLVRKLLGCDKLSRVTKTQGASGKRQAPSSKHQAASHELQALQYFFLRKVSRC